MRIEGKELPAGSYALYSIPGANEWTVIFNKVTGEWGAYSYKQENDALRVQVKPVALSQLVETFTIDVNDLRAESATLNLLWEKTRVPVKLQFEIVKDVVAQIDAAMASGAKLPAATYFNAAQFYYENGLDLKKARTWIDEATQGDKPPFYMLYWKARILAKLGDKQGAIATAKQSIAAAEGPPKAEYVRLNETLIASLSDGLRTFRDLLRPLEARVGRRARETDLAWSHALCRAARDRYSRFLRGVVFNPRANPRTRRGDSAGSPQLQYRRDDSAHWCAPG